MSKARNSDIIVIGAGIAGASIAAELSKNRPTVLLEMEDQPGYHTTGRSAALYAPSYGPPPIRALTRASWEFFSKDGGDFPAENLISPRTIIMIARLDQMERLRAFHKEMGSLAKMDELSTQQVLQLNPLLRADYVAGALRDNNGFEIDVAALHQGYLRRFKANGGLLICNAAAEKINQDDRNWTIATPAGRFSAPLVVNATGAWADQVNVLAGQSKTGLVPKRRTMIVVPSPPGLDSSSLPMTVDIDEQFYIKPDAGQLILSPADETPSPPCDAQPEELDIAIGIDRIERAMDISVKSVQSSWAGLRSFVADGVPTVGFMDKEKSYFLFAGQGGYGIQIAPALSLLAAAQIEANPMPLGIRREGISESDLDPKRLL